MTDQTVPEEKPLLPFANWLAAHRSGVAALEWAEALNQTVEAVTEHGKAGKMVVTITVSPLSSDGYALEVSEAVVLKLPTARKSSSIFYADDDHNLVREDPAQQRLPLAGPSGVVPNAQEG